MIRSLLLGIAILAAPLCALAQTPDAAPPPPCGEPHYRQFDFWVGDWEVRDAAGALQGTNTIESILGGCVLQENWKGASGSVGSSFNIYDRQTARWHQTWVDNSGLLLRISGGLEDGAMVLRGDGKARDGAPVEHRITWTPLDDGRVRQHWQMSSDAGESWTDLFVGLYSRTAGGGSEGE